MLPDQSSDPRLHADRWRSAAWGWTVILPLKRLELAKSRMRVAPEHRQRLAIAMAHDVLTVCHSARNVVGVAVVCQDPRDHDRYGIRHGTRLTAPLPGLNAAIELAEAHLTRMRRPVALAVLPADLPFLTPEDLERTLVRAARQPRSFVPDAPGTGTTLLTATGGAALHPQYGPGSAVAHGRSGARELSGAPMGLRRDVDRMDDLTQLAGLGAGTTRALAEQRTYDKSEELECTTLA